MSRIVSIYHTLQNRGNQDELLKEGPKKCTNYYDDGKEKAPRNKPWLGEGYYFWDTVLEDAHWWGKVSCNNKYYIFKSQYDVHSKLVLDLTDVSQADDIRKYIKTLKDNNIIKNDHLTMPMLLAHIQKISGKSFSAVRALPTYLGKKHHHVMIELPDSNYAITSIGKVQVCFYDKKLLNYPFTLEFKTE